MNALVSGAINVLKTSAKYVSLILFVTQDIRFQKSLKNEIRGNTWMKERRHKVTFLFLMFLHLHFNSLLGGIFGPGFWVGREIQNCPPPTLISNWEKLESRNFLLYTSFYMSSKYTKRFLLISKNFWWRYQIQIWLLNATVKYFVIFNNSWQQKQFFSLSFGKWKLPQLSIS